MVKVIVITLVVGGVLMNVIEAIESKSNKIIDNMESKRSEKLMRKIKESGV